MGPARVLVHLPRSLREYWAGDPKVHVEAATLAEVLRALNAQYPGLGARILDDTGRVRPYVNVFLNQQVVSHLPPGTVTLSPGDEVHILPSVAGGDS